MERETHKIDAKDRILGRMAAEIVALLRGKKKPDFAPHKDIGDFVVVQNVDKIRLTGKKAGQKKYYHHSGYLGGIKEEPFKKLFERDAKEVLRKAVLGMLPKNKLRAEQIKRLKFE